MLSFAVILGLVLIYVGQNLFNRIFALRYDGKKANTNSVFTVIYGTIAVIGTLALNGFSFSPSFTTVWLGILCGIMEFSYNLSMIGGAQTGPFAFQSLVNSSGAILVQIFFAMLIWGERLSTLQVFGIVLMIGAFVIFNLKGFHFEGVKKGYWGWLVLLFFSNGFYGTLIDSQQRLLAQAERSEMIAITFITCTVISAFSLLRNEKKDFFKAFRMKKGAWSSVLISGCCATVAVNCLLLAMRVVPASLLIACTNGGILVLTAIACKIVFKEKITWYMALGMALATAAIIMLNI